MLKEIIKEIQEQAYPKKNNQSTIKEIENIINNNKFIILSVNDLRSTPKKNNNRNMYFIKNLKTTFGFDFFIFKVTFKIIIQDKNLYDEFLFIEIPNKINIHTIQTFIEDNLKLYGKDTYIMKKEDIYVYDVNLGERNKVSNIDGKVDKFLKYSIFKIFTSQNPALRKLFKTTKNIYNNIEIETENRTS